jgi:hypothetical protein
MIRAIIIATFVAGTLDITMAGVDTALKGGKATGMLRSVASGPFPGAGDWGAPGAAAGLGVHFAIMAVMATVFVLAYTRSARIRAHPVAAGAVYGIALWLLMYGLVLPLRFGAPFPNPNAIEILKQLFAHIVLVGIPIGWITAHTLSNNHGTNGTATA